MIFYSDVRVVIQYPTTVTRRNHHINRNYLLCLVY
jgi:hypothetical protein